MLETERAEGSEETNRYNDLKFFRKTPLCRVGLLYVQFMQGSNESTFVKERLYSLAKMDLAIGNPP